MNTMQSIQPRGRQQGFTIIELVVVILLLGILTATALPRFMDVTDEAHEAVLDGVAGGLRTATGLFHAEWTAEQQPAADSLIDYGNGLLITNANGYPYGVDIDDDGVDATDHLGSATGDDADTVCEALFNNLLQTGAPSTDTVPVADANTAPDDSTDNVDGEEVDFIVYSGDGGTESDTCTYDYTADSTVGDNYIELDTNDGTVTLTTP